MLVEEEEMRESKQKYNKTVAITDSGPVGLANANEFSESDVESLVIEKDKIVGGISNNQEGNCNRVAIPVVSVIIPSYNASAYIRKCLLPIRSQSTELPFEVIMVDSSNDGTDQIVVNEFPEVRLFHFNERLSAGAARNTGLKKVRGEVVLFLDTDCITKHTWIDQMYTAIKSLGADGVGGSVENGTPWSITGSTGFYLEFFRFLANGERPYTTPFLIAGNSGFRKEVFKTCTIDHLFNDDSVGEDFIFNWELMKKGKVLMFLPSVTVRHLNKTGFLKVLRYQYKLGIGAYSYRSKFSSGIIRLFNNLPVLTFFIPVGIMGLIGSIVLRRRGILEFFKFIVLLPFLYISNNVWAIGFYRELIKNKTNTRHSNNDVIAVGNFQRLFEWIIHRNLLQKISSLKRAWHE